MTKTIDEATGLVDVSATAIAEITRSEIESQVATARRFPRDAAKALVATQALVCANEDIAGECIYALRRTDRHGDIKIIEGASVRFAEVLASSWGNNRAGARTLDDRGRFITAQGVFHDLESNVAVTIEVKRRITTTDGRRYGDDMIGVTSNAANSIAYRNAVLKGIPKALWFPIWEAARRTAIGTAKTLSAKRDAMLNYFSKMGIGEDQVLRLLKKKRPSDVSLDDLAVMRGIANSIKDGESTLDQVFALAPASGSRVGESKVGDGRKRKPK